jgi:hypothetical protein
MEAIQRYTLNSGQVTRLARRPLSRRTLACLRKLVPHGGGSLPGVLASYACRVEASCEEAGRLFWLLHEDQPLIAGAVCWESASAATIYHSIQNLYFHTVLNWAVSGQTPAAASASWLHAPIQPVATPWLVRVLLPGLEARPTGEQTWLDEFERCLAWTLLSLSVARRRAPVA